jgi:hypothetical protein
MQFGPYPGALRVTRTPQGVWTATVVLRTAEGDRTYSAVADEQEILRALIERTRFSRTVQEGAASGFINFKKLGRSLKKVARSIANNKVVRGVMKTVNKVVNNPLVRGVLSAIPGVGVSLAAIDSAKGLLSAIEGGSKKAVQSLKQIETAARAGNPLAAESLLAVRATFEALEKVAPNTPAHAVSGAALEPQVQAEASRLRQAARWVYEELRPRKGYRGEADAFTAREAYRGGLDALLQARA